MVFDWIACAALVLSLLNFAWIFVTQTVWAKAKVLRFYCVALPDKTQLVCKLLLDNRSMSPAAVTSFVLRHDQLGAFECQNYQEMISKVSGEPVFTSGIPVNIEPRSSKSIIQSFYIQAPTPLDTLNGWELVIAIRGKKCVYKVKQSPKADDFKQGIAWLKNQ